MTGTTHIAHLNWAVLRADWDDPVVAEFVGNIGRVNAVAERSPGYVWRMSDQAMEAEQAVMHSFGNPDRLASTLSVWESPADFAHFVHRTVHGRFLARRSEWFEPSNGPAHVIWPIPAGHRPTIAEARARADRLIARGPGPEAYDLAWYLDQERAA